MNNCSIIHIHFELSNYYYEILLYFLEIYRHPHLYVDIILIYMFICIDVCELILLVNEIVVSVKENNKILCSEPRLRRFKQEQSIQVKRGRFVHRTRFGHSN